MKQPSRKVLTSLPGLIFFLFFTTVKAIQVGDKEAKGRDTLMELECMHFLGLGVEGIPEDCARGPSKFWEVLDLWVLTQTKLRYT